MDYERKYKKALERAKKLYEQGTITESLGYVFPELQENEDERIRKALIRHCKSQQKENNIGFYGISLIDVIAWLEKQSEQKSADKITPKFKVGDWIVFNGLILHIDEIVNGYYRTTSRGDGIHNSYDWNIDNAARLWTIQDAKDGDVLTRETGEPFIYNGNRGSYIPEFLGAYCGISDGRFRPNGSPYYWGRPSCPATNEQRELLFQKMNEAGYEWDNEKKELIKN